MSRIGKLPVENISGVEVQIEGRKVKVVGPKGEVEFMLNPLITIEKNDTNYQVVMKSKSKTANVMQGTMRSIFNNAVLGVSQGWSKKMELVGTGFRSEVQGTDLILTVGFSHPVKITAPKGISFKVEKNIITIEGADKAEVGQICAKIQAVKPPEPYKGKGILFVGEVIRRKAGKAAKTAA